MDRIDPELEDLDRRLQTAWDDARDDPAVARVHNRLRAHIVRTGVSTRPVWGSRWTPTILGVATVAVAASFLVATVAIREGLLLKAPAPAETHAPVQPTSPGNPAQLGACAGPLDLSLSRRATVDTVMVSVSVTNFGDTCHLRAPLTLTVTGPSGKAVSIKGNGSPSTVETDLIGAVAGPPSPVTIATYAWANWCGGSGPFALSAAVAGYDYSLVEASGPRCTNSGAPSQLVALETPSVTLMPVGLAVRTVTGFYDAINARDYRNAYAYFGAVLQNSRSYDAFAGGFSDTVSDQILRLSPLGFRADGSVSVTIDFIAHRTSDSAEFAGTYVVGYEAGEPRIVQAQLTQIRHMSTP